MKQPNFTLIAGPCLYENEADLSTIAETVAFIANSQDIDVIAFPGISWQTNM